MSSNNEKAKKEKIITERYGHYKLEITYREKFASVKVEDLSSLKFPLIFSEHMSKEQANVYLEMFKELGYIPIVDVQFMTKENDTLVSRKRED